MSVYSLQDYSIIKNYVKKTVLDNNLNGDPNAFMLFSLKLILNIQDDEAFDSITDTNFLKVHQSHSGHDRGVDAVYIDDDTEPATVHIFNFKYTESFDKTQNNFPSGEIDKIVSFLSSVMQKDTAIKNDINMFLYSKVEEIWSLFDKQNPNFVVNVCGNYYEGFEKNEKARFEREINRYSNIKPKYFLMEQYIESLTQKSIEEINCKVKAVDKNYFEKPGGDVRALIVELEAIDLIRMVLSDESIRLQPDFREYNILKRCVIQEDAFEDNVRVYLKQRSRINKTIKETILSKNNHRFFYFNNGITIACDSFIYPTNLRAPIIEINGLQIVNGSQTIHALYDAFIEEPSKLENVTILCRIYETKNQRLKTKIAEYTNSQNPVKSRDIRSIDYIQQKLEQDFLIKGIYYERKKNQHQDKPQNCRIDSEKLGQVLLAFYNRMPGEAKNKKSIIFGDKFEEVFSDEITADCALLPYRLYEKIEVAKEEIKKTLIEKPDKYEKYSFILHSSYYILYTLGIIAEENEIKYDIANLDIIWSYYNSAIKIIKKLIEIEQKIPGKKEIYSDASFFKSSRPKEYFQKLLTIYNIDSIIKGKITYPYSRNPHDRTLLAEIAMTKE